MPRLTRQIHVGTVAIGGGAPVSVQSMTNTDTRDVAATLAQIRRWPRPAARSCAAPSPTRRPPRPWPPSAASARCR